MRPLMSRLGTIVVLSGLAWTGVAQAQSGGLVRGGPGAAATFGKGFGPGRSSFGAGDVGIGARSAAFGRRGFGQGGRRGVIAPVGFGSYGYGFGGYGGFGIAGYGLPLTAGIVDPFGIPLDAGPPPPPNYPVVTNPDHGPSLVGIAPSPVKPPAIYVIGGDRRAARSSARDVPARSSARDVPVRQAESDAPRGPRIITIGPDRS